VIVDDGDVSFFLAGDASYTQRSLIERKVDGVSPSETVALHTLQTILRYAEERHTVYLPTHDPESADRLRRRDVLVGRQVAGS
jgi:N-acyl homoserine lactone hydrolase